MLIRDVDFTTIDWSRVEATQHPGKTGTALWRTFEAGNVRVRIVEYSAGCEADHWCERGHVLYVLDGVLITHLRDGRSFTLTLGCSYQVSNGQPHMSVSPDGARLFIVD